MPTYRVQKWEVMEIELWALGVPRLAAMQSTREFRRHPEWKSAAEHWRYPSRSTRWECKSRRPSCVYRNTHRSSRYKFTYHGFVSLFLFLFFVLHLFPFVESIFTFSDLFYFIKHRIAIFILLHYREACFNNVRKGYGRVFYRRNRGRERSKRLWFGIIFILSALLVCCYSTICFSL